ncbi:hypothetical protein [Chishuiella sp.]|uniref:hypothetical protein n=1 Tax=Chishuiella sp. TaxID=1969467 RepID=UPI0028ABDA96|nr:hypothetical protein [Chishuiella sp.]
MKKIIYSTLFLSLFSISHAQVSIGKEKSEGSSTIFDFNNTNNTNGIILPAVTTTPNNLDAVNNGGTFIFDQTDSKVKMFENGSWVDLSDSGDNSTITKLNLNNTSNEVGNGVVIGANSSNAKGVLVLESDDKAMILPYIAEPEKNVKSPYPGMICYDTKSNTIALFDGKVWNYWK